MSSYNRFLIYQLKRVHHSSGGIGAAQMLYRDVQVIPGQRVYLSVLGKARCPRLKLKSDSGIILKKSGASAVVIRFDGRKQPVTLHLSYVEMR